MASSGLLAALLSVGATVRINKSPPIEKMTSSGVSIRPSPISGRTDFLLTIRERIDSPCFLRK